MAKVLYIHWNEEEAYARAKYIEAAGHEVTVHWDREEGVEIRELPDYLVVSLDRLASHGRAVVEWFWEAKRRQHIPVIFEGGAGDKVDMMRMKWPKATYTGTLRVDEAIEWIIEDNKAG